MSSLDQIAFFWVGLDNQIPTFLVKSINLVYKNKVKIYHLTNSTTRRINGTTKTIRLNLSENLMVARLQAYKNFPYNNKLTFFCDADSLFLQKLNLFEYSENISLYTLAMVCLNSTVMSVVEFRVVLEHLNSRIELRI